MSERSPKRLRDATLDVLRQFNNGRPIMDGDLDRAITLIRARMESIGWSECIVMSRYHTEATSTWLVADVVAADADGTCSVNNVGIPEPHDPSRCHPDHIKRDRSHTSAALTLLQRMIARIESGAVTGHVEINRNWGNVLGCDDMRVTTAPFHPGTDVSCSMESRHLPIPKLDVPGFESDGPEEILHGL